MQQKEIDMKLPAGCQLRVIMAVSDVKVAMSLQITFLCFFFFLYF